MSEEKKLWGRAGVSDAIGELWKWITGSEPVMNNPSSASGSNSSDTSSESSSSEPEVSIPSSSEEASTDACENEPISSTFFEEPIHVVISNKTTHPKLTKSNTSSDDNSTGVNEEIVRIYKHEYKTFKSSLIQEVEAAANAAEAAGNTEAASAAYNTIAAATAEAAANTAELNEESNLDNQTIQTIRESANNSKKVAESSIKEALNKAGISQNPIKGFFQKSLWLLNPTPETESITASTSLMSEINKKQETKTQKDAFNSNLYDFSERDAEMFASFVFPDHSRTRCFTENHSTTVNIGESPVIVQKDNEVKIMDLEGMIEIAVKLLFMVKESDPITEYRDNYIDATDAAKQAIRQQCNYGLWGKFYETTNGWHRGIDMNTGGSVYSLCNGEIVGKDYYYLCIYNSTEDATFTYMHLSQSHGKNIGATVVAGELLGTESNIHPGSGTMANHTHVEVNKGRYSSGFGRPESVDTGGWDDIYITDVSPGENFSLNPYSYIESVFSSREVDAANTSSNAESSVPVDPQNTSNFDNRTEDPTTANPGYGDPNNPNNTNSGNWNSNDFFN